MSMLRHILKKIRSLFVRPIPVFVFHHVSDTRDPLICAEEDWTQTDLFKRNLMYLKQHYTFISLQEAVKHLKHDKLRFRNYAVLTADDGLRSTYELLPWLIEQNIPVTLFICPKYLDGRSYIPIDEQRVHAQFPDVDMTEVAARMFIKPAQLHSITSPLVTIASHGYAHLDATAISEYDFEKEVMIAKNMLENHPRYVPFFAYTWGRGNVITDNILKRFNLTPVLCDGRVNNNWMGSISRKCIDNLQIDEE